MAGLVVFILSALSLSAPAECVYYRTTMNTTRKSDRAVDRPLRIRRRLEEVKDSQWNECRGSWQEYFVKFQAEMLRNPEPKILVAVPNLSGLADRTIGFVSVFMMSMLTGRAFQIASREPLPDLEEVFYAPFIDWHRPRDPNWLIEPLKYKATQRNYNESVLASKEFYGVNTIDDFRLQDLLLSRPLNEGLGGEDVKTTMISINRGLTIRMSYNEHHNKQLEGMGLTAYNTFGCIANFLVQPKERIFGHVFEQFMKMSDPRPEVLKIGVQIRVGDWLWNDPNREVNLDDYKAFFSCAQQIEDWVVAANPGKYSEVIWYLATESIPVRRLAKLRYGKKLVTSLSVHTEHSSKEGSVCGEDCKVSMTGFRMAAAEWWMLGFADYFVITRYSGYGRSAGFRSLKQKDNIYTIHNGGDQPRCDANSFSDLETMAYDWSGI